jgi:nucleoside-diphosphate-sugar epimerase
VTGDSNRMRLTVLGATGRTGVTLVEAALGRGHGVHALARDATKAAELLPPGGDRLEVVVGDLYTGDGLTAAVAAADAVVDVSGPVEGGPDDLRRVTVRHLLPAMEREQVRRLVFLTGAGVRLPDDRPGVPDRLIRGAMSLLQPRILEDGQEAVAAVMASSLDWTVVRVPRLTDGHRGDPLRSAPHVGGGTGTTLGRGDLAAFLLDEVEKGAWVGKAPVLSW